MAITWTDRGSGTNNSSALTFTATPGSNFNSQNSMAVLVISADNADTSGNAHSTFTVTDSSGNIWTRRTTPIINPTTANTGVEGACFTSYMNNAILTTGTTITVTFDVSTTAETWILYEAEPDPGYRMAYVASGEAGNNGTGTSPSIDTDSITSGNIVIGMLHVEYGTTNVFTEDGDTTNGSWSAQQTAVVGTGNAGIGTQMQAKVVTATGVQTYNPTFSISSDWCMSWIELTQVIISTGIVVTVKGNNGNTTSGLTFTCVPTSNFTAGTMAVLLLSVDNADTSGNAHSTFTVTDTIGNTWTRRLSPLYNPSGANSGVEGAVFTTAMNVGPLTTGTTITTTFDANTAAKTCLLIEVSPVDIGYRISYVQGGVNSGAATTTPTVTTETITSGNIVFSVLHTEYSSAQIVTADADESNGLWSARTSQRIGVTTTGMGVLSQYKIVTGTAAQTCNYVVSPSSDNIMSWFELTKELIPSKYSVQADTDSQSSVGSLTSLRETSGPTNLTPFDIRPNQCLRRATSGIIGSGSAFTDWPGLGTTHTPVALWKLDQSYSDTGGSGYHMTLDTTSSTVANRIDGYGEVGPGMGGVAFNGATALKTPAVAGLQITGDLTIQAVINMAAHPGSGVVNYIAMCGDTGETAATNILWSLGLRGAASNVTEVYTLWEHTTGTDVSWQSGYFLQLGVPYHITVTRTGSGASVVNRLYINGELRATSGSLQQTTTSGSTAFVSIGASYTTGSEAGEMFNGIISNVKIVGSQLSDAEVRSEYQRVIGHI